MQAYASVGMPAQRWAKLLVTYRRLLVIFVHLLLWTVSFVSAFGLRFDFNGPMVMHYLAPSWLVALLMTRLLGSLLFGSFRGLWRYTGSRDLQLLLQSTTVSSLLFATLLGALGSNGFPRSIFIIDWLGTIFLVGGLRFTCRVLREVFTQVGPTRRTRRVLIVGAGSGGEMLLREMQKAQGSRYRAVGFVDDDPHKRHGSIHGVPVLGTLEDIAAVALRESVDEIIIAIARARGRLMRQIVAMCQPAQLPVRTVPSLNQLMNGEIRLQHVRDVAIEDLLGRPQVALDATALRQFLVGQVVLVTGAGGSIGAELCRQASVLGPRRLILLEQSENALFCLEQELARAAPDTVWNSYVGSVCDTRLVRHVLSVEQPTVILHSAAHKHVPLMERNPNEAIKNNIGGTRTLADLAHACNVAQFVMISTDKAVNPTSVMGATKRVAEMYVQALASRSKTRFSIVRFGNVLGSQGSVIPIFQEQIARGGPVTVTHPEMRRYFMTIPEACQLVLQAATMGTGGELFVLDMGEPVKIVDLARDLIILSGLVPDEDIDIQYVGMRSGEKLFEELSLDSECAQKTRHPKIFTGTVATQPWQQILTDVLHLESLAAGHATSPSRIRTALAGAVLEYKPAQSPELTSDAERLTA